MPMTTVLRRTPEGWQKRTQLHLDNLLSMERETAAILHAPTAIGEVFAYWQSRARGGVVRASDFAPLRDLGEPGVTISQMDISVDNPWHYRFTSFRGVYFGWMHGRCLADHPVKPVVDDCAIEYYQCKCAGEPVAHHIAHNLGGFSRDYLRLLLPLAGADGSPTALALVGRHLALQAPAVSSEAIRRGWTRPS